MLSPEARHWPPVRVEANVCLTILSQSGDDHGSLSVENYLLQSRSAKADGEVELENGDAFQDSMCVFRDEP